MGKLSKEQLYELYITQELTASAISKQIGKSTITVQRWLQGYDIKKKTEIPASQICDKETVLKLMEQGLTHKQIADYYNITLHQFRGYLRCHVTGEPSNHSIDESLIDENNPMFWYIVGLISTDGHIPKHGNTISIFQKDYVFLSNLKDYLKSSGKLNKRAGGMYTLYITSEKFCTILKSYGFGSDKRYSVPFLDCPDKFLSIYFRGIFDGDGCIYYNYISGTLKSRTLQVTSGSKKMIDGIKKRIDFVDLKVHEKKSQAGNKYWDIFASTQSDIVKLGNFMYEGCCLELCLLRKYTQFQKFKKLLELDKMMI